MEAQQMLGLPDIAAYACGSCCLLHSHFIALQALSMVAFKQALVPDEPTFQSLVNNHFFETTTALYSPIRSL